LTIARGQPRSYDHDLDKIALWQIRPCCRLTILYIAGFHWTFQRNWRRWPEGGHAPMDFHTWY